jgi:Tfp pilus assembly protein PilZ
VQLRVRFQSAGELQRCLLTNLSRGGVFVTTNSPAHIGTQLKLRIVVTENDTEIEVDGELVGHNVGRSFATGKTGMGVRYHDPSPRAAAALARVYEGALGGGPKRPR